MGVAGDGRWKLYGLASWTVGCGKKDHPAVFTRVSAYTTLIQQTQNLDMRSMTFQCYFIIKQK